MGNDGGSIPKRRELVKEAARTRTATELKESQHEQLEYYWSTDPLSQKPLVEPIVSDSNGKLYNKDSILEFLVEGSWKEDANSITRGAVKSLKDVVEVKFESDSDAAGAPKIGAWKCPVTGDLLCPGSKAVYLVPCGHAFCGNAMKEVSGERCITCDQEYAPNDVIPILPTAETDIARLSLRAKTLQEKGLTHSLKKASGGGKKRKKRDEAATEPSVASAQDTNGGSSVGNGTPRSSGLHGKDEASGIKDASTASLAAKVMAEQTRAKKLKTESENVRSLFSSKDSSKPAGKSGDFMTRGFSIPNATK